MYISCCVYVCKYQWKKIQENRGVVASEKKNLETGWWWWRWNGGETFHCHIWKRFACFLYTCIVLLKLDWILKGLHAQSPGMSDSATPWSVAHQASLSMGFPRREYLGCHLYRVGCHLPLHRILLTQGSNPCLLHWQADSLPLKPLPWETL